MTNVDSNELFALLRDVRNGAVTVEDAAVRILDINKSDMKDDTPNPSQEQLDLMPRTGGIELQEPAEEIVEDKPRTKKAEDINTLKGVSKKTAPKD